MRDINMYDSSPSPLSRIFMLAAKIEWCTATFGPSGPRWHRDLNSFRFANPKDETLFKLRFPD